MGEESANFASEAFVFGCAVLSQGRPTTGDLGARLTDDFVYEDRRPRHLLGRLDSEHWREITMATWATGAGNPQYRARGVLAVRGERFAVCGYDLDFGNGMMTENLGLIGFDATLTLVQVIVDFDIDDVDAAIAELDRLHSEGAES